MIIHWQIVSIKSSSGVGNKIKSAWGKGGTSRHKRNLDKQKKNSKQKTNKQNYVFAKKVGVGISINSFNKKNIKHD